MNGPLDSDNQDRSLWRQYASRAQNPQAPQVDANALAAYLDGSAEPEEVELVEARMALEPAFVDEVMALRQMANLDFESTSAPPAALRRAKDLTRRHIWWPQWAATAAAAAVLLACLVGYSVGNASHQSHRDDHAFASLRASLQMDDLISDPAIGIILPVNGNNGR